jgi:hypothetical protein
MPLYKAYNAPMATTAATAKVTTGTAIKTMLQIATPSTRQMIPKSWGFSLDAAPATTGVGVVELIQTDVAATVTAHVAAGIQPLDPNGTASLCVGGTALTGYTGTAEGTTTASRLLDVVEISGVSNGAGPTDYRYQFLPEEWEPVAVSKFLRVRVTFSAAVNMLCWVVWDE